MPALPNITAPQNPLDVKFSMIRQPYRITMAKWNYSAVEKRILTTIISQLQKEISAIEKGIPFGQLDLFKSADSDTIKVTFPLSDIVLKSNNYSHVKAAFDGLMGNKVEITITLPATAGKVSKKPEEKLVLTRLIERTEIYKNSRTVTVTLHHATALELIKTSAGLTSFAKEVMFMTDNRHTQKIYEIISHWKDRDVITFTIDEFKEKLSLTGKYPKTNDMIRNVIEPAEIELKAIADIYFEYSTTKDGKKITKINFAIKQRKVIEIGNEALAMLKEDTIQMLRQHFAFKNEHFNEVKEIMNNPRIIKQIREKLSTLHLHIKNVAKNPKTAIYSVPEYVVTALKNEFEN